MSKMISCKSCGKEIAKSAKSCPGCGAKNKKPFYLRWWFILIVIIVLIGIVGGGSKTNSTSTSTSTSTTESKTETETKQEVKEEVIQVSAVDLAKAYEENEVSADKSYKDKTAEINGKIDDIGVVAGQTYIVLSAEKDFAVTNVQCFFEEQGQIDKIANLKKGDTVKVKGKIDGKSMNVSVNNCILE